MSESLNPFWLVALTAYEVVAAVIAVSLYWVIRLGVRGALRDHSRWVVREASSTSGPEASSVE
ncbi:MAG: hypothetical protein ABWX66_00560 [Lacisediminihabitans sp.]